MDQYVISRTSHFGKTRPHYLHLRMCIISKQTNQPTTKLQKSRVQQNIQTTSLKKKKTRKKATPET